LIYFHPGGTSARMARSLAMASPLPPALAAPRSPAPQRVPSVRLRLANAALRRLWSAGWANRPSLDPEVLIAKAAAATRLDPDADRVGWRARLDILCDDLDRHARLSDLGRTLAHGQLVAALGARFRAHALWRRHPEIAERPVTAPIIVVGQMRSGSTRMQRLLACDPRLTYTRFYESWNPIPTRPGARLDARKMKGRLGLGCALMLNPDFATLHPTAWHAPDEEIGLHNLSIFGAAFEAQWRVPHFTAAIERDEGVAVYREFRHLLQTLGWARGDAADRPWILKVPQFTQDLPALLRVFPDARVIHLRRDPADVVASSTSLVCNQMQIQSHHVDARWVAREWARKVALRERRVEAARGGAGAAEVEVSFDDVTRDWHGEMRRVYRLLGLPLTAAVRERMRCYLRATDPARRPRHVYEAHRIVPSVPLPAPSPATA
jgi:hypothetical protein